jgi:hypothetical protein
MLDKTKVVLLAVITVLLAIILYFIYIQVKLAYALSQPTVTITSATSQPTTTITSMISSSLPQSQQAPLIISQSADWQITLPLITDKWVVVVSPTTSNQYFSAYLSMTGKVDDTAIEIVPPTVIPNTSLLTTSTNFSQYAGYPYLIINSSAPFTVYVGFARD